MSEIERKKALRKLWKILDKRTVSPVSREKIQRAPLEAINELIAELEGRVDSAIKAATENMKRTQ